MARKHGYRIAQIVMDAQGWIGLIRNNDVVARFTNWDDAKRAYRAAVKAAA